ncbi:hypothetical protein [Microbacterium sp. K2]|uniref:hypothetical protein n=1 Tax=Microbacterium sp. K2 TaxID=3391827 RepID=UPI003EDA83D5
MADRDEVVEGTKDVVVWWLENRQREKFEKIQHATFNPNPFLLPVVASLHGADSVEELGEILLAGHLVSGHNTGFGKLFDEKLLPRVFGTIKLSKAYRKDTPPFSQSAFNDIDHIVRRVGYDDLLSLKASKWTINLGGAKDLNRSFEQIRGHHMRPYPGRYGEIAVGVLYGQDLTDKYQVLRGETQRQRDMHDVIDLTDTVNVYPGRAFWTWLNDGESGTQDWVMEGVLAATEAFADSARQKRLIRELVEGSESLSSLAGASVPFDWNRMLREVNG